MKWTEPGIQHTMKRQLHSKSKDVYGTRFAQELQESIEATNMKEAAVVINNGKFVHPCSFRERKKEVMLGEMDTRRCGVEILNNRQEILRQTYYKCVKFMQMVISQRNN